MKKWIPITAITAVVLVLSLMASIFLSFQENNEVFTRDFFKGVKSAHITFYQDPIDTIEGLPLLKLCQDLSALEIESESKLLPFVSDPSSILDMPIKLHYVLVLTYHNGDTVCFQLNGDLLSRMELDEDAMWVYGLSYSVTPGDDTAEGMILSYFDRGN